MDQSRSITFPGTDPTGIISCRSNPMEGISFRIDLTGVQVGAVVLFSWQGFRDQALTDPIRGTRTVGEYVVEQSDIDKRFLEGKIGEYFKHIKPIRYGWGKASYTIEVMAKVEVNLLNSSGQTCDEVKEK
ncbi:hypothetical protein J3P80_05230 [Pseudomonas sp. D2-30]|uniref:hypothetical protein n=1 Tax=unclassified Pseudomonas TaxID=196821 RepID=UPI003DA7D58A